MGDAISNLGLYMIAWWVIISVALSYLAVLIHKQESKMNITERKENKNDTSNYAVYQKRNYRIRIKKTA